MIKNSPLYVFVSIWWTLFENVPTFFSPKSDEGFTFKRILICPLNQNPHQELVTRSFILAKSENWPVFQWIVWAFHLETAAKMFSLIKYLLQQRLWPDLDACGVYVAFSVTGFMKFVITDKSLVDCLTKKLLYQSNIASILREIGM